VYLRNNAAAKKFYACQQFRLKFTLKTLKLASFIKQQSPEQ